MCHYLSEKAILSFPNKDISIMLYILDGSRVGAVVTALASHQYDPGSILGPVSYMG